MARRKIVTSVALDLLAFAGALVVASLLAFRTPFPWHIRQNIWPLLGVMSVAAVVSVFVTMRSAGKGVPRPSYGRAFSQASGTLMITALALVVTRFYWSRSFLLATIGTWLALSLTHRAVRKRRPWAENLVIVTSEKGLVDHLMAAPHANIVEVLDPAGQMPERPLPSGTTLAIDLRAVLSDEMARFVSSCNLAGYPMRSLSAVYEEHTGRLAIVHLHEGWELTVPLSDRSPYVRTKRFVDTVITLAVSPIALLLGLMIATAIKIDSRGRVLFVQDRIGKNGRDFRLYKFRTMRERGDTQPRFAARGDERLTRVGKVLRRFRVDELPQLWNVLRGDLSLVGPRPEQKAFVDRFSETIPFYTHRHLVRPGITGWSQVNFGYADSDADTVEKLSYDLYYIKHVSPWLDLEILGRSVWTVLSGFGAR